MCLVIIIPSYSGELKFILCVSSTEIIAFPGKCIYMYTHMYLRKFSLTRDDFSIVWNKNVLLHITVECHRILIFFFIPKIGNNIICCAH